MSDSIEFSDDAIGVAQRCIDGLVAEGAEHATLIVTYKNGQQVMLKSSSQQSDFFKRLEAA